jgi:hypothetical protein
MREAPLTDGQKTEKGLYGSYAPRVRGRAVTPQTEYGSLTRRGGGAAMNSKIAFVSAMLALAAMSVHTPQAVAARPNPAQQACESRRYLWIEGRGCADKSCTITGTGGAPDTKAEPGTTSSCSTGDGKRHTCSCDGFTGQWGVVAVKPGTTPPGSGNVLQPSAPVSPGAVKPSVTPGQMQR